MIDPTVHSELNTDHSRSGSTSPVAKAASFCASSTTSASTATFKPSTLSALSLVMLSADCRVPGTQRNSKPHSSRICFSIKQSMVFSRSCPEHLPLLFVGAVTMS